MRRPAIALLACVLLSSPLAVAQEQRGAIEGVVEDASGGVLPGVTVGARRPALVGTSTAVTDTRGEYRFPSLSPGVYEVTATLQGFTQAKTGGVRLELGQILRVDLT